MYSMFARERRQCTQIARATGERCRCYAVWGDDLGRCSRHGGVVPMSRRLAHQFRDAGYAARAVCHCDAYRWPHRPGGGLCRWPHAPGRRCETPLGTRSYWSRVYRTSRRFHRWRRMQRTLGHLLRSHGPW
jgi:hypothetical protein